MIEPSIGVCCLLNPLDPKVWSKTPANISAELRARQRLGPAFAGLRYDSLAMKLRAGLVALRHGRPHAPREFLHGASLRQAHGRHIVRQIEASGVNCVLHFAGDRYLPLPATARPVRHFLLIDGTWAHWHRDELDDRYQRQVNAAMRTAYHQMEHIFCISDHARESLVREYQVPADKISVVGSGTGTITPYHGPKDYTANTVLFVARNRFREKGGELLLEGYRLAREKNPSLQLWLVASPDMAPRIRELPGARLFSELPSAELQKMFDQATLFALPALMEPWGLVFLEALGCRTPVLGLDRGALRQITQDGRYGFLIKNPDPREIAAGLLDAFSEPARLEKMGHEGQRFVRENFTWDKVVQRMLDVIDRR
jgi:glycosyltransferase involved in cell wall biosynthesis